MTEKEITILQDKNDIPHAHRARKIKERKAKDTLDLESASVVNIDIAHIRPNRMQPRAYFESNAAIRLADSIRRYGILQPLCVRVITESEPHTLPSSDPCATPHTLPSSDPCATPHGAPSAVSDTTPLSASGSTFGSVNPAKFEIVAGERRFRAAKMLGMRSVPCIIVSADDKKSAELALIENIIREDLGFFEMARAIEKLIKSFALTQEEVAKSLSMSQSAVANKLRLLRYNDEEQKLIEENGLTERHARAILRLSEGAERIDVINFVVRSRMNVQMTEKYVDEVLKRQNNIKTLPEMSKKAVLQSRKLPIIKDIRLFYNSLDKALGIVRSAGVEISSEKREDENGITIEISIPNPRKAG